jgi:hypothetical protein
MLFAQEAKNCASIVKRLEAKGINAEIIYTGGNYYNVLIPINKSICLLMSEDDTEKAKTINIYDTYQMSYLATLCESKTNWLKVAADFVEVN